jgi:hypothetical protein
MLPLISAIQRHVATVAIGPSTVRGQGAAGIAHAARGYLAVLPLNRFRVSDNALFRRALDTATTELKSALPRKAQSWGLARKCLNIFLRDSFYNAHLLKRYGLSAADSFFEIPLDAKVARKLRRFAGRGKLPPWPGVKKLRPEVSDTYQASALDLSTSWRIERVYLDSYLWVDGR